MEKETKCLLVWCTGWEIDFQRVKGYVESKADDGIIEGLDFGPIGDHPRLEKDKELIRILEKIDEKRDKRQRLRFVRARVVDENAVVNKLIPKLEYKFRYDTLGTVEALVYTTKISYESEDEEDDMF